MIKYYISNELNDMRASDFEKKQKKHASFSGSLSVTKVMDIPTKDL